MSVITELVNMRKGWQGGCVYWGFFWGWFEDARNGFNYMINGVCMYAFVLREGGLGGWVGSVCVRACVLSDPIVRSNWFVSGNSIQSE